MAHILSYSGNNKNETFPSQEKSVSNENNSGTDTNNPPKDNGENLLGDS